jgi:hypothetical protein
VSFCGTLVRPRLYTAPGRSVRASRDAENPYTISDNDADGVPDRKMTGLPRSFKVFELDSINWRPKVRATDAATTQPSVERP